jgi:Bacterial Ig-like domain (group 3)
MTDPITFTQPAPGMVGGTEDVSADVSSVSAGAVTFSTMSLNCSVSSATVTFLSSGPCAVRADQAADSNYKAGSAKATIAISPAQPMMGLVASPMSGSVAVGGTVTFTATVTGVPNGPALQGTVNFMLGGSTIPGCGAVSLDLAAPAPPAASTGTATCTSAPLTAASSPDAKAFYGPDPNYLNVSAPISNYLINQAEPNVGISAFTQSSTVVFGDAITLTGTVTGVANGPVPSGLFTFTVDGNPIEADCTDVALTLPASQSNPPVATATCVTTAVPAGNHTLRAFYHSDPNYLNRGRHFSNYLVVMADQTIVFNPPAIGDFGQQGTLTATAGASPVVFTLDSATTDAACSLSGTNGSTVSFNHVGLCVIDANQPGDSNFNLAPTVVRTIQVVIDTGPPVAPPTIPQTITVTPLPITGAVGAPLTLPATGGGSGNPVTAVVDGATAPDVCSVTGLTVTFLGVGTCVIDLNQAGNATYLSAPPVRLSITVTPGTGPTITAQVTRAHAPRHGWYASAVTITFTCTAGAMPLAADCPSPVTLGSSGRGQTLTRTIADVDGQTANVVLGPINIDLGKPMLRVRGVTSGHTYQHGRTLRCVASDGLSGVASCVITKHHHTHHGVRTVHYTAVATDVAGNVHTIRGHFRVDVG